MYVESILPLCVKQLAQLLAVTAAPFPLPRLGEDRDHKQPWEDQQEKLGWGGLDRFL